MRKNISKIAEYLKKIKISEYQFIKIIKQKQKKTHTQIHIQQLIISACTA